MTTTKDGTKGETNFGWSPIITSPNQADAPTFHFFHLWYAQAISCYLFYWVHYYVCALWKRFAPGVHPFMLPFMQNSFVLDTHRNARILISNYWMWSSPIQFSFHSYHILPLFLSPKMEYRRCPSFCLVDIKTKKLQ